MLCVLMTFQLPINYSDSMQLSEKGKVIIYSCSDRNGWNVSIPRNGRNCAELESATFHMGDILGKSEDVIIGITR